MTIEISDQIIQQSGLTKNKLLLELALILFQQEHLTLGQASHFAGMHQYEFQQELGKRKIAIHYDVEDFERDLETLKNI